MLHSAVQAARNAGEIIKTNFNSLTSRTPTYKHDHTIVTDTDVAAEQAIFAILKKQFPDHAFFSEEAGMEKTNSEYLWVIDPLDGTSNFAHHLPFCCVSIALFKQQQPVLAVVYDPINDELFTAKTGKGARLNNTAIYPSETKDIEKAVVIIARGTSPDAKQRHAKIYPAVSPHFRSVRVLGSAALGITTVASGRFDAMIMNDCNFYDCAAANMIGREAGAIVSDFQGKPLTNETQGSNDILVINKHLQPAILEILMRK